jgi:pyrroloquinoline quinone biosynthesis protein D
MTDAAEPGLGAVPRIGAGFRLQWEPAQDCHVLLYPEGMVKLNQSGGEILKRCDGQRSVAAIVADLEQAFSASGLERDVLGFMAVARKQHWLTWT